jgi:hypothetical protein
MFDPALLRQALMNPQMMDQAATQLAGMNIPPPAPGTFKQSVNSAMLEANAPMVPGEVNNAPGPMTGGGMTPSLGALLQPSTPMPNVTATPPANVVNMPQEDVLFGSTGSYLNPGPQAAGMNPGALGDALQYLNTSSNAKTPTPQASTYFNPPVTGQAQLAPGLKPPQPVPVGMQLMPPTLGQLLGR